MDIVDRALVVENMTRDGAIARARAAVPRGDGAVECRECGEVIPAARRRALPGVVFCVECQRALELERGRG